MPLLQEDTKGDRQQITSRSTGSPINLAPGELHVMPDYGMITKGKIGNILGDGNN